MRLISRLLLGVAVLGLSPHAPAQAPQQACVGPEHRAFDFWLGEWEVRGADGKRAGSSRITREYGGCVIHERYDTGRGYRGESLNVYDAPRRVWHQTWVDTAGLLLLLDGGLRDGHMVLEGRTPGADGAQTAHRIRWTPNPDGTVRQLWESTDAAGAWKVIFDGTYVRKPRDDARRPPEGGSDASRAVSAGAAKQRVSRHSEEDTT